MTLFGRDSMEGGKVPQEDPTRNLTKTYAENMTVSEGTLPEPGKDSIFHPDHELHDEVFKRGDIEPFNPAEIDPNFTNFLISGGFQKSMEYLANVHTMGIEAANAKAGLDAANFLRMQLAGAGINVAVPLGALRIIGRIGKVHRLGDRLGSIFRNRSGGGSGGGSGSNAGFPGLDQIMSDDDYSSNRLSLDLPPTEVRLETGIVATTYSPSYQYGEAGYQSPVHATGVQFTLPGSSSDSTDPQYLFFYDAVLFDLKNAIQRNITFSPTISLVDDNNLRNALQAMIVGLTQYYAVSRYLVYGANPMNKNECLLAVRDAISSTIGDKYMRLRRTLEGTPIPPNLNGLIYWLHQFYTSSESPGSPVIMINPNNAMTSGLPTFAEIDTAINGLNSYNDTYSLIGRAIPQWYSTQLLTGNGNVLHDPTFTTLWTNLPIQQTGTTPVNHTINGVSIGSYDGSIYYNSWSDALDGGAFGMTSTYYTATSKFIGLLQPVVSTVSTNTSNRYSWYDASLKFVDSYNYDYLLVSRDETYVTGNRFANGTINALSFGAERCNGVTYRVICECAHLLLDWIMSWETVNSTVSPARKFNRKRRK